MNRIRLRGCFCLSFGLCAAVASSAPFAFYDSFTGIALQNHWDFFSEGSGWEHTVQDGRLKVSRLFGPFQHNEVAIVARTRELADFRISARLGWDLGQYQTIKLGASSDYPFFAPRIATVAYDKRIGDAGRIVAYINGGGSTSVFAPPPGEHIFTIQRRGSVLTIRLNGQLIHASPFGSAEPLRYVWLEFQGPDAVEFGQLTADYVLVQPLPIFRSP